MNKIELNELKKRALIGDIIERSELCVVDTRPKCVYFRFFRESSDKIYELLKESEIIKDDNYYLLQEILRYYNSHKCTVENQIQYSVDLLNLIRIWKMKSQSPKSDI